MGDASASSVTPPQEEFDRLRKAKDYQGLAAAYVAWKQPEQALSALDDWNSSTPDAENDRAAILLELGRKQGSPSQYYEDALKRLELLLAQHPEHRQAHWNRALALEALGLSLRAAHEFRQIARGQEKSWADEAHERAEELISSNRERNERWKRTTEAGEKLVSTGQLDEDSPLVGSPLLRLYFYDAVRTRTSREEVLSLQALAERLDGETGGDTLQKYVERVALEDFSRRAPLAREYAQFRKGPQEPAFLDKLLRSKKDNDLALGAIILSRAEMKHLDDLERLAFASKDPWFEIIAAQKRAEELSNSGDYWSAEAPLQKTLQHCESARLTYRCVDLEVDLAHLYARLLQPDKVVEHAQRGWNLAQAHGLWSQEIRFLEMIAQAARLRDDVPVARAYLYESLDRIPGHAQHERHIHQSLAHLEIHALDFGRAREEIDRALATGLPLTQEGVGALSDIARQHRRPQDEEAMNRSEFTPTARQKGERALALHFLGRFHVEQNRAKGQQLLRESIREADLAGLQDENAIHARTYSYTSLILDAARENDFDTALMLFGEELALDVPGRCVLAITSDSERSLVLARGEDGVLRPHYEGARKELVPENLEGFVPAETQMALEPCEKVEVLARPPLQGRIGLLPHTLAWSYRTRREAPRPQAGKPIHLVVKNVKYDPSRKLEQLSWKTTPGPNTEQRSLDGAMATPSRVLREMGTATEVDLATHGLLSPVSGASYLVLAKESGEKGTDELQVRQLRQVKLKGAPLIVLAACYGGFPAPVLHEPVSLPNAMLKAGARAVLAATQRIPDQEASAFFDKIRERIRQGASLAVALRDERVAWRKRQPGETWMNSVLLFE